jgi:ABC-type glycerol-3-phosphate transport system substrate-binding protein
LKKKGISLTSFATSGAHIFFSILFGHPDAVAAIEREEWETEPFQQAVEVVKQICQEKFIPDNDIELQFAGGSSLFQIGRLGHYMNGAWTIINEITAEGVDPKLRDHVEFTPFPTYNGARPIRAWVATKTAVNSMIADKPEKIKAAMAFLELFTSPDTAPLFASVAHSPEGVKLELTEKMAGSLLYRFMGTRKQATGVFVLPSLPWKFSEQSQVRALPDMFAAINEGATAKKALSVFAEVLRS